jgi:hypothetical protein
MTPTKLARYFYTFNSLLIFSVKIEGPFWGHFSENKSVFYEARNMVNVSWTEFRTKSQHKACKKLKILEILKYLRMPLTNQHCMHNKIKSQLHSRNVCHTVHSSSSSHMLCNKTRQVWHFMWMTQVTATTVSKMLGNGLEYMFLRSKIMYWLWILLLKKWNCGKASECLSTRQCDKFCYTSDTHSFFQHFRICLQNTYCDRIKKPCRPKNCTWITNMQLPFQTPTEWIGMCTTKEQAEAIRWELLQTWCVKYHEHRYDKMADKQLEQKD